MSIRLDTNCCGAVTLALRDNSPGISLVDDAGSTVHADNSWLSPDPPR